MIFYVVMDDVMEVRRIIYSRRDIKRQIDPVLERSLTVERITETRPCPVCGRAFLPDGRQRYCSPVCAGAALREQKRAYMRRKRR